METLKQMEAKDIATGNRIIAEFMGFPKVTIGSFWDYDRSLDNSSNTKELEVVDINERDMVSFKQKMPYANYGLSYFDGVVFYPSNKEQNKHNPSRRYHTSWDWLMGPYKKAVDYLEAIESKIDFDSPLHEKLYGIDSLYGNLHKIVDGEIMPVWEALVEFINWFNQQSKQP
jgi:hypothetical protein